MRGERHELQGAGPGGFGVAVAGWIAAALTASLVTTAAQAQTTVPYKVIGADGKVTYTDRPAPSEGVRVTPIATAGTGGPGGTGGLAGNAPLPIELRTPVARYPVTLYTADADCEPCAAGRQLLRQRGIPFTERQVSTNEDILALERLSGGRDTPTLAIGSQILRGLAPEVWMSYLDAAAYPRDSRLPANYQYAAATPLVMRSTPAPAPEQPAATRSDDSSATLPNLPNASGFRF